MGYTPRRCDQGGADSVRICPHIRRYRALDQALGHPLLPSHFRNEQGDVVLRRIDYRILVFLHRRLPRLLPTCLILLDAVC